MKDERNKQLIFKNCALFAVCICSIRNKQVGNTKDLNVVMPMHNVIEYRYNYSKKPGSLLP